MYLGVVCVEAPRVHHPDVKDGRIGARARADIYHKAREESDRCHGGIPLVYRISVQVRDIPHKLERRAKN